jgi:polysaccharide export outer membrane protein
MVKFAAMRGRLTSVQLVRLAASTVSTIERGAWGGVGLPGTLHAPVLAVIVLAGMGLCSLAAGQGAVSAPGYRVGPKDLLEIKVSEVPELNLERRIADDGTVTLPLVGAVDVSGLSISEVVDRLKAVLEERFVQRASVTVQIKEFRSKPITVIGAVKDPGYLAFTGRVTLIEALSAAGGLTEQQGVTIYILRQADNGLTDRIAISADDLMLRANPEANIPIFAGDVVNVPPKQQVTVFCLGELKTAGALTFAAGERTTVLTAVAKAGGLTDRASNTLRIKRRDRAGKDAEIEVNFKRVLSGKDKDPELLDGDILIAKESFF